VESPRRKEDAGARGILLKNYLARSRRAGLRRIKATNRAAHPDSGGPNAAGHGAAVHTQSAARPWSTVQVSLFWGF
jgi:hypothetical protein